tara:strand:+ start:1296 stop:2069 length:774 start_codon:yes stop_codon:yes gene_type:complete
MIKLTNKISYVLGGNGLIGFKTASLLSDLGSKVIILDKVEKQCENNNHTFEFFDLGNLDNLSETLDSIFIKHGGPDIFINSSYPRTADWASNTFSKIDFSSFRENIDLHLNGFCISSKIVADQMVLQNKKGSIVMVSSIYGYKAQDLTLYENTDLAENMTYPVIKSGINHFAKQMASYYGPKGVRINTVLPSGLEGNIAGKNKNQDKEFVAKYTSKTPLRRMATPSDIAHGIAFLASDASAFITGHDLKIDGGLSII